LKRSLPAETQSWLSRITRGQPVIGRDDAPAENEDAPPDVLRVDEKNLREHYGPVIAIFPRGRKLTDISSPVEFNAAI